MLAAYFKKQDRWFWIQLALFVVFAWRSYDWFFGDEHYQILEFASIKLGHSRPVLGDISWEYTERARPWFQAIIYFGLLKFAELLSITDPFSQAFVVRLFTGMLYFSALRNSIRIGKNIFPKEGHRALVFLTVNLGFLYYFGVRHASETLCACFLVWCLSSLSNTDGTWSKSPARLFLSGLLAGFAFDTRYQIMFTLAALVVWYILFGGLTLRGALAGIGGGLIALGIGILCDRWGYGVWVLPIYNYYRANIVDGFLFRDKPDPFYAYLYYLPVNYFFPVSALAMLSMFVFWVRHPRHPVTWASAALFVGHSAIGHKEERYIFPLLPLVPIFIVGAWLPSASDRMRGFANVVWNRRKGSFFWFAFGWNYLAMALLLLVTANRTNSLPAQRWMLQHLEKGSIVWHKFHDHPGPLAGPRGISLADPPAFYNRGFLSIVYRDEREKICDAWASGRRNIYWYGDHILKPNEAPFSTRFLYNEFPFTDKESVRKWVIAMNDWYQSHRKFGLPAAHWDSVYQILSDPCPATDLPTGAPTSPQ